eukprot:m.14535 g.14535  ORF g.14535 m.14535 type:complete len:592 (+) comp5124_c0_seq1:123-1898(+)
MLYFAQLVLSLVLLPCVVRCDMYNLVAPLLQAPQECSQGCAAWDTLNTTINSYWAGGKAPEDAGSHCAQLPYAPGLSKPSPLLDPHGVGAQGAWCVCSGDISAWGYCTSSSYVPEQVNLQLASPDTVVVSFVTFEPSLPAEAPYAMLSSQQQQDTQVLRGVTHVYVTPAGDRTYYMHFVKFSNLAPLTKYTYSVKSGATTGAVWSKNYTFTSPHSSTEQKETSVAIFGDLGIYAWNNFQNMMAQVENDTISAVIHIGDHCYNIGGSDDRRGDGYMQGYEPILSSVPWIPVVGNHEFYDGDHLRRYLNQTEGTVIANNASVNHEWLKGAHTTATSALGYQLSSGNHHAAGLHGTTPSGTSRYFSVDLGLVHFVALDLNMYNAVDDCGEPCRVAQLAWLKQDLAAANANRDQVPWIVAMSHFPLYCSNCPKPGHDPGAWWSSEACEFTGHDESCTVEDKKEGKNPYTGNATNADMVPDFEPIFMQYGVDVYASGHIHDFEWTYPIYNNSAVQKNFVNMKAPVHLVTGNAGPPSASRFSTLEDWSYSHSNEYSYTQLIAHNASAMSWIQIANNDSRVIDRLTIITDKHGPFPPP